jgi:hypothetical protein
MSQPPPPLPPEPEPQPPIDAAAAEAVPAQPPDTWPPPAPPLGYSLPTTATTRIRRPSTVTTLGVTSIVVAVLSAAGAVLTAVASFLFFAGAQAMSSAALAAQNVPAAPAPRTPTHAGPETGPNGLPEPVRRGVVDAFYSVRPLRPPRIEQLNAILARDGKTILLTPEDRRSGAQPAPEQVRRLVTDHGELFSRNLAAAPDYFRMSTGRLELYDDRAVFYPADGSATIRSAFGRAPGRRALAAAEAAAVVQRARQLAGGAMNEAQAAALASALAAPDQKLVATSAAAAAPGAAPEPNAVTPGAGGAVTIRFADADLYLGPQGEVLSTPPGPAPPPKPSTAAFLTLLAASLAGLALAVLLFVAAVLLLRGLPSGRRLHVAWAWFKIPVTAVSAVAFWWMAASFYEAINRYDPAASTRLVGGPRTLMAEPWQPVAVAVVALVYPVVVLVLMRSQTVRQYFAAGD